MLDNSLLSCRWAVIRWEFHFPLLRWTDSPRQVYSSISLYKQVSALWAMFLRIKFLVIRLRMWQNLLFLYSFSTLTVVNNGFHEPHLLLKNSSFTLRLSESQGMFNLGKICQNSEAKFWKPASSHQPVLCSLIRHALWEQVKTRVIWKLY